MINGEKTMVLKVRIMAKWDNSPFSKKEQKDLKQFPPFVTVEHNVSCPCGKFKGQVKEMTHEGDEYRCPACGNYNMLMGMLYVRIIDEV
jgi:DNA-directed RNA polymerase subunit RPC12/RpoP